MAREQTKLQPEPVSIGQTGINISVVVPFYNAERHIEHCIKALLAQNYATESYEIIMVDNNSTDGSAALVRKYPRIKLLSEQKQSAYAARNRGIAAAKGTLIAFTDADCMPASNWLQELTMPLCSPEIALVQGERVYATESAALSMLATYESERASFIFLRKARGLYYGYTNNMAVRRDAFHRCGAFLEIERGADSLFVHRVIAEYSCDAVSYAPNARIRHLEITSVWKWLRKWYVYGRSFQQNYHRRKRAYRPMTCAESSVILKGTIQQKEYSLPQTLCLITLLWVGRACYLLGRLSTRRMAEI
jgi:glycosyltransferase involved in cell wall biosynthesis